MRGAHPLARSFASEVDRVRRARGLSYRALGRDSGVGYATIFRFLTGYQDDITIGDAVRLAEALDLSLSLDRYGR